MADDYREEDKQAYRDSKKPEDCPYQRLTGKWWSWIEGYIYERTHYPRPPDEPPGWL